jgi:hypothetical protein
MALSLQRQNAVWGALAAVAELQPKLVWRAQYIADSDSLIVTLRLSSSQTKRDYVVSHCFTAHDLGGKHDVPVFDVLHLRGSQLWEWERADCQSTPEGASP